MADVLQAVSDGMKLTEQQTMGMSCTIILLLSHFINKQFHID